LTKEQTQYQIGCERKLIERLQRSQQLMREYDLHVRPNGIGADIAAFDMAIESAEARIKELME
jgi:hypothetical protein